MKRIAVVLAAAAAAWGQGHEVAVRVAEVVEKTVAEGRTFVGTALPSRQSVVGSTVEDVVVELLVREGDRVEEGQPLVRLRTATLTIQLDAARALLEERRQELAELENGSRPEEVAQARARVGQTKADVDLRRWKLDAAQRLFDNGTITEDEVREAQLAMARAEERHKEDVAALALVEAGPRKERIARAAAAVAGQEAEVRRIEDDLERHTVRAPFAGHVVAEHTEVGQWVDRGGAVVELVALDEIDVRITVLEDHVPGLRVGMPAAVSFGALPGDAFAGTVQRIVPSADVRARAFPVEVRVANKGAIKAGMFAQVTLPLGEPKAALLVPKDALVLGGPAPMVYVVNDDSTVLAVPVELGVTEGELIQVKSREIAAGQRVVVRGNERLHPGVRVRVAE
jgi:multidrug efflux pump subunit AcrA (membrane-fusion protein)